MTKPNILFIMSDDHASHAMSCYGSRINQTPNLDRIAREGMRFDNCFCTNSLCEPSRAGILTGTYNHVNGATTIGAHLDNRLENVAKILQRDGYQTAIVGKWHLGQGTDHWPTGFDYWNILQGQGPYFDPEMVRNGEKVQYSGYTTDLITDLSLDWLKGRDRERPFFLMYHHKAPHRHWEPDDKHAQLYEDVDIPEPRPFDDDYSNRAHAAREARMRVADDLNELDLKQPVPEGLNAAEEKSWKYQRYIKDYLRCVASIDDNVGRVLDYLEVEGGVVAAAMVIYTSDQGFFLGDHGWYDKRFMYEESLRMPFIIRYPREIEAGSVCEEMMLNVDFAPTWLDCAGIDIPDHMQGRSCRPLLNGNTPGDWQQGIYYRYWMHLSHHNVAAHYGVRTHRYKLIYYYGDACGQPNAIDARRDPEWELFDLQEDPCELNSVYGDTAYCEVASDLTRKLHELQDKLGDQRHETDTE